MKTLFRKLARYLLAALSGLVRPLSLVLKASIALVARYFARINMPQASFWSRCKSALTIPEQMNDYGVAGYQSGFASNVVSIILGAGVAIVGIIVIISYIVPQAMISSGNMTTAMTTAGASTQAIQWWTWIMWGGIVLVVVAVVMALARGKGRV